MDRKENVQSDVKVGKEIIDPTAIQHIKKSRE